MGKYWGVNRIVCRKWHNPTRQLWPLRCLHNMKWHHKGGQGPSSLWTHVTLIVVVSHSAGIICADSGPAASPAARCPWQRSRWLSHRVRRAPASSLAAGLGIMHIARACNLHLFMHPSAADALIWQVQYAGRNGVRERLPSCLVRPFPCQKASVSCWPQRFFEVLKWHRSPSGLNLPLGAQSVWWCTGKVPIKNPSLVNKVIPEANE